MYFDNPFQYKCGLYRRGVRRRILRKQFGMVPEITLPNTKIRAAIPLMKYVMAVKDYQFKDHGLFPNYNVVPKIADKINGNDLELEFAKKLINK